MFTAYFSVSDDGHGLKKSWMAITAFYIPSLKVRLRCLKYVCEVVTENRGGHLTKRIPGEAMLSRHYGQLFVAKLVPLGCVLHHMW